MPKAIFQLCKCTNPMIHGHVYLKTGVHSPAITSLVDARVLLQQAVEDGLITPEDQESLMKDITEAGVPENGPDEATIQAYQASMAEYQRNLDKFFEITGLSKETAIEISVADLTTPNFEDEE